MDITEQLTHESRIALAAAAEITRLRARLEVRDDGGPDGILCRDESIRMQDAEIARLRAEVEALKAENAALASWQCLFTDGTTGLYHDGCGNAQCARDHLVVHLTAEVEALRADAERLDCGQIMISTLDEFGEPKQVWHTGMNLRAAIDAAMAAQSDGGKA